MTTAVPAESIEHMFEEGEWAVPGVPVQRAAPVLSPEVLAYGAAVEALAAVDPGRVEPAQALAEAAYLLATERRARVLRLERLADVSARGLHALDDAPTTSSWLARQGGDVDRAEAALAVRLHRTPGLVQALREGWLPVHTAVQLGRSLDALRPFLDRPDGLVDGQDGEQVVRAVVVDGVLSLVLQARGGLDDGDPALSALVGRLEQVADRAAPQLARLEAALLVLAEQVPAAHLAGALEQLVAAVLPVRLQERADRAVDQRGLRLVRRSDGGGWTVRRGDLDDETGELLQAVLAACRATDPDNPLDTAGHAARHEDEQAPPPRSRDQQDHDALRLGLRALLDSGALGTRGSHVPHLGVTVGLDGLHGAPGALPAVSTVTGAPLALGTVRRWLADSTVTRFVLGLGRRVLETSHSGRTLKPHERRALLVQWGGRCAAAGCSCPPTTRLVPHHLTPWHLTGTTSWADSAPLGERCHAQLHRGAGSGCGTGGPRPTTGSSRAAERTQDHRRRPAQAVWSQPVLRASAQSVAARRREGPAAGREPTADVMPSRDRAGGAGRTSSRWSCTYPSTTSSWWPPRAAPAVTSSTTTASSSQANATPR